MKLYGNKIEPRCLYCEHGTTLKNSGHISCRYYGVVTDGYTCRKFKYDPLKRIPSKPVTLPKFEKEDFSIL